MLGVLLYHLGAFFSRILPYPLPQRIARVIGEVSCWTRVETRRVLYRNLRLIHGDDLDDRALRRRVRATIHNFARCIQIFLELPFRRWEDLRERVDFSEFDAAVDAIGRERPFVLATAHVGPWELGGYCLSKRGYPIHTVALDHPSRHVTRFFSDRRKRFGIHAYPLKDSFGRLAEALEKGEVVALISDRAYGNARRDGVMFGVRRAFPLGHALLAGRCNVPLLTGAIVLDGEDRYRYVHGGTHIPDVALDDTARMERLHDASIADLERIIRDYSDQWFHFRPLPGRVVDIVPGSGRADGEGGSRADGEGGSRADGYAG